MKKIVLTFIIASFVLGTVIFNIFSIEEGIKPLDIIFLGVTITIVGFAIVTGLIKARSIKRSEPVEDELSRRIMKQTSSLSFYISLYLWLAIMYMTDKLDYEPHVYIATGILGMALVFACCWIYFTYRGIGDE